MTGYGEAQGEVNSLSYIVEIKTVNNRYLKTSIKLPEPMAFLEEDIDELLRSTLARGTVNYALRLKTISPNLLFNIDEASLRHYVEKLSKLISSADTKCRIDIGTLLSLPGIVGPILPDEKIAEQIRQQILNATRQALDKLKQMRNAEGSALAADLKQQCLAINKNLEQIRSHSNAVLQEYHKKLKKRVDELLADAKLTLDADTLSREVALFAERSDISEEIIRLESHLLQFTQTLETNEQAGRRLDFISQEMLREANTITSKASDTDIIHWGVDIKCRIDRIKEQVQNIE
jgi:uncharacterized protein (TIGR00255 family)